MMTNDKTKWARLAAFIDAEGCIGISRTILKTSTGKNYYGYDLKVSVANTSMKLMRWLVRYFGGEFRPKQKGKLGVKPCFEWFVTGGYEKMEIILLRTLPYHIIKREQALIALEWVRMRGKENPSRRAELHVACMALNSGESPTTNMSSAEFNEMYVKPACEQAAQDVHKLYQ